MNVLAVVRRLPQMTDWDPQPRGWGFSFQYRGFFVNRPSQGLFGFELAASASAARQCAHDKRHSLQDVFDFGWCGHFGVDRNLYVDRGWRVWALAV
jgi:hypothetical protein